MEAQEVRYKIKEIIAGIADLDIDTIADDAHFVDDLGLDSLSLLEIGVDVDYEFKLGVPEERLGKLRTLDDAVALVQQVMAEKQEVA